MASSSVSQDDIDTDFEKNSRRSRIRTARAARQINACRAELLMVDLPDVEIEAGEAEGGVPTSAVSPVSGHPIGSTANPTAEEDLGRRSIRGGVKKGKQHRERRKLREKRRSTGVVHLASTESTGGSTTPDEVESSDNETKRNTLLNESDNVLLNSSSSNNNNNTHRQQQQQMPSDLEADDENDADHSYTHNHPHPSSQPPPSSQTPLQLSNQVASASEEPVVEKVVEENRRLLSMMDEKDKRIHHLEFKIEQLMKDTLTISEEQSRLQKENKTLLRALNNLSTKDKP